jgi:hypothetical protein
MAAAVPPAAAIPAVIYMSPGEQGINPLDYSRADDIKLYQKAIKGLEESDRFDLSPTKLKGFLDNVRQKSEVYGWSGVMNVPTIVVAPAVPVINNILDSYGKVTLAQCVAHATTYITAYGRTAQNSGMLYHFLFSSLTPEARNKVSIDPTVYTMMNMKDGLCFLRNIIMKAQLGTIGTIETLRSSLGELPVKLVELSGNIVDFHQHVNTLTNTLDLYGQAYPELIINLFKAYKQIEDNEFSTYVMITRFGYNTNPDAYQSRTLMEGVENTFKLAVEAGTWSPNLAKGESSEITALRAEVASVKANTNKEGKADRNRLAKYAWKKVAPSEGDPKTKQFEDRAYNWCSKHKMWTMHKESECKGVDYRRNNDNTNPTSTPTPVVNQSPQAMSSSVTPDDVTNNIVKVNEAMETIVEYSSDHGY